MEFKVGSLANLISGVKSHTSAESKLFQNVGEEKEVNIKFQAVHKLKKTTDSKVLRNVCEGKEANIKFQAVRKSKKEKTKRRATEDDFSVKQNKKKKTLNKMDADCIKPETVKSSDLYVKHLQKKRKREITLKNQDITKEREDRSIFVGNVPHNITVKKLKKMFEKYGKVESVRFRCPPLADPRVPKKVAVIKRDFHPDRSSMHAFVRFVDVESAQKALVANGTLLQEHHLRVDMASGKSNHDQKKAVFVGNVPFAAEDDDLWKMFESCGNISGIRLVRDRKTGIGKGFAYVNFESADAVELALKLDGEELNKRKLRVQRCVKKPTKKSVRKKENKLGENRNQGLKKSFSKTKSNEQTSIMKEHVHKDDVLNVSDSDKIPNRIHRKSSQEFSSFQGQKISEDKKMGKKKKKKDKTELKKLAMISKLAPKSKSVLKKLKKPVMKTKSLAKKIKFKPSRK